MRLIFLNRFFYPDHSATSQMLSDLAFGLAKRGHSVDIIASRQCYGDPGADLPPQEHINGVVVHRVATTRFGRANLLLRTLDYLTFYLSAAWMLWRLTQPGDIVIVKTDPPLLSVIVTPIALLRGARLVNWLQDVFPEVAVAAGLGGKPGHLLFGPLRFLRNLSLKAAAANVVLGERMAERLRQEGAPGASLAVIPNWSDGALVKPVPAAANALREQWGLTGRFVVGYSGNLGRVHELDAIVEAMSLLQEGGGRYSGGQNVVFLFIGGGALHGRLRQEAAARGLSNCRTEKYQPMERLAESLSAPDIHLASLRPEFEGLVVPSKLYGILAAGRPTIFIGDDDGEVARLLREAGCGACVPPGDGPGLARRILELAESAELRGLMGEQARATFDKRFDREIAIDRWGRLLAGLKAASPVARGGAAQAKT